ncbi:MAG: C10 family peptidase, partial [Bacteroidaceae bacterium]|nr:C10 family peptidase [Bacteroidaceae bacterium]
LNAYAAAVEGAQELGINTPAPRRAKADRQNIAALTTSKWHQSSPYNDLAPSRVDNGAKSTSGCVATAAAQILYYWRRDLPTTLQATTPTYSYGNAHPEISFPKGTPIRWELMCDSYSSQPAEYWRATAELVYCVGTATGLTYSDGDGTATSGHIEKIPATFSNYFGMNGGWVAYRSNYSQESWTQLLYDQLALGRPVMYTGVNASSGGHAVYVHGYQASTDKFLFNFGWGGQGDGWYTTSLTDGMNGFNDYQSALIDAYPKALNVTAKLQLPPTLYTSVDNEFTADICNNSTLSIDGVYVFVSSTSTNPTDVKKAQMNVEALVPSGESAILRLTARPTGANSYVTLTDKNLNVLAKQKIQSVTGNADLAQQGIELYGSADTELHNGTAYTCLYHSKVTVKATVTNAADEPFGGTARMDLYSSTDDGATFTLEKTQTKANAHVPGKGGNTLEFAFSGLTTDKLYYAELNPEWGSSPKIPVDDTDQFRVYFCSKGETDLAAELQADGTLTFSGHWDATQYIYIVGRTANASATAYDLTAVTNLCAPMPANEYPNPNALVYVPIPLQGDNLVYKEGSNAHANDIRLTAGYDFVPKSDLRAFTSAIDLNIQPNIWNLVTVPFEANVPDGIIARQIDSHRSSGIVTTNVTTLSPGQTYLVMASSSEKQQLRYEGTAETIDIKQKPVTNLDPAIVGTYAATPLPAGGKIIKTKDGKEYFSNVVSGGISEGLRGYFYDETMTTAASDFRAFTGLTLDPAYQTLGTAIQALYDAVTLYGNTVNTEAANAMNDSIAKAESIFSAQSLESASEVKQYVKWLEEWVTTYRTMLGNVDGVEVDMTGLIGNPSFEESSTSAKQWTAANSKDVKIRSNADLNYKTVGGEGVRFLNNLTGSEVSQTLTGMKEGYYRLTAMVGAPEENAAITLSAGSQQTTVASHAFGKHYLTEASIDSILVLQGESLTIGIQSSAAYYADRFSLTYIGRYIDPTPVDGIRAETPKRSGIYDLQGRAVKHIKRPGLYVVDGKKMLVK